MEVKPTNEVEPNHEIVLNMQNEDDTQISNEERDRIMELVVQNNTLIDKLLTQRQELQQLQTEREQLLKLIDSEK